LRIRIKDIAAKAGVSTGTVDRVLHKRGKVSEKAKARVEQVMKELGYKPNFIASALAYNRRVIIACLVFSEEDLYWSQIIEGMNKGEMATTHYGVTLQRYICDEKDRGQFIRLTEEITCSRPDAVLLAPLFRDESYVFIDTCKELDIPVALINTYIPNAAALCYIGQDSYQSGLVAGRLIDLNLKKKASSVLLLNFDPTPTFSQHFLDKEAGFRKYFDTRVDNKVRISTHNLTDFECQVTLRQQLLALFEAQDDLSGIFVTNSRAFKMLDCLDPEHTEHIMIVAFDLIAPNLAYLKAKRVDFLINQNPVLQGYLGIINLVNHILLKEDVTKIQHLPLDIAIKENCDYYQWNNITFPLDSAL